ncbi:MAG: hypothetical protein DRQ55_10120 [Planctomycetota bacterium]|nr:MAG: hypothetical protein DRQ55_10120 [Planctomycetota bacterium]
MINPARPTLVALALAGALLAVGCSSTETAQTPVSEGGPDWVDRPQSAYDDGGTTAIYAVGIAANNPNPASRRAMAIGRGRTELANTLNILVQGMVEDYQSTNRDFYEGMDTASSLEMWSSISRQVTDQVMSGSQHVDSWRDPGTNTEYVLMMLEFNNVISAYKDKMEASFRRDQTRERIKVDQEAMMGRLDEQLDALRGRDASAVIEDFKLGG